MRRGHDAVGSGATTPPGPPAGTAPSAPSTAGTADLVVDLEHAIRDGHIEVAYQPIVDAWSRQTVKLEALARWPRTVGPPVTPDVFIPLAEQHGLICDLDLAMLGMALGALDRRRQGGAADVELCVNFSALTLAEHTTAERVDDLLLTHDVPASALWVEATESVLVDAAALECCRRLERRGVRLALDDLGTGFSSLSYLMRLPIHALKIDRSFTSQVGQNPAAGAIVHSIALLGRELGIDVVAEGVESELVERDVRALGVTQLQGYLYGRPAPATEIEMSSQDEPTTAMSWAPAAIPPDELGRLAAVRALGAPDAPDRSLDNLVQIAADVFDVPMVLVNLVDSSRQWCKASVGTDLRQTTRDVSFCAHAILTRELLVVEDAINDDRFAGNPLVQFDPQIRFYAGAPLITSEGYAVGTVCIVDRRARLLSERERRLLTAFARDAVARLEDRSHTRAHPA